MITFRIADEADQQFATILNGRRVTIRLRYNPTSDRWSFNLSIDDEPVLHGRRIVTGVDLLKPFSFGIGMIVALPIKPGSQPNRTDFPEGNVRLFHALASELTG